VTTKNEAINLIEARMVQPKDNSKAVYVNSLFRRSISSEDLPRYTNGAARFLRTAVKRTRLKDYRNDPVEEGKCLLDPGLKQHFKDFCRAAQCSVERGIKFYYQLQRGGLMQVSKGTSKKGWNEVSVAPARLLDYPEINKIEPKTQAQRMKAYRARKRAELEALKMQLAKAQEVSQT